MKRFGIIGCGRIAPRQLTLWQKLMEPNLYRFVTCSNLELIILQRNTIQNTKDAVKLRLLTWLVFLFTRARILAHMAMQAQLRHSLAYVPAMTDEQAQCVAEMLPGVMSERTLDE